MLSLWVLVDQAKSDASSATSAEASAIRRQGVGLGRGRAADRASRISSID